MRVMDSIENWLGTFKFKIYFAFFSAFIIFLVIAYYDILDTLNIFATRANNRLEIIEHGVDLQISNVNYIVYGIATSIKDEPIKGDNLYLSELVSNFFPQHIYQAIPIQSIKIIGSDNQVVLNSRISQHMSVVLKKYINEDRYIIGSEQTPFKLVIGNIFFGSTAKEKILPLCVSVANEKEEYLGAVCANLLIETMLYNYGYGTNFSVVYNNIELLSHHESDLKPINEVFTLKNLFKSYLDNKPLVIGRVMDNYPILIRMEVNYSYLNKELKLNALYCLSYFVLSIMFGSYLLFILKRFYQNKLYIVGQKAAKLQQKITPDFVYKGELLKNTSPEQLVELMENILNYVNSLYDRLDILDKQRPEAELKNNILNIILTEHHYYGLEKIKKTNVNFVYLEQLRKITNEKAKKLILPIFLREIIEYCAEYYSDLNISIQVSKKDYKAFDFKHAALSETIFHIFGMITRIGTFNPDAELLVKGVFNKNIFPTIYIEAILVESSIKPIGLTLGASYIYSGLLPIYLLAKENNLLFNIEKRNQKLIFSLEPIESKKLQNLDNSFLSAAAAAA